MEYFIDCLKVGADIATIAAVFFAWWQIRQYKKRERANTFARFSERYSNDKNIQAVVQLLMREEEGITLPQKKLDPKKETNLNFQKEMFLRFFEELQIALEAKTLDPKVVYDEFAYYALRAYEMGTNFYDGLTLPKVKECCNGSWYRFRKFVREMECYQNN